MCAARVRLRILEIFVPYDCRVAAKLKNSGDWWGTFRASSRLLSTSLRIAIQPAVAARLALTILAAMACMQNVGVWAQQAAPSGVDIAVFAAKRFPQAVRSGDLIHRVILQPTESRSVLGHVVLVIQLDNGRQSIVMALGGMWGFDARNIAVPLDAMVIVGQEMEVLDFTPEQLRDFPTYNGRGRPLGADEIIHVGLAHPSH
jgi:hypothetical protein